MTRTTPESTDANKLLISVPTGPQGSLNHSLVEWLLDVSRGLPGWAIATDIVRGRPVAANCNQQIRRFLWETDADYMLSLDDDMVPETEGLKKMLDSIQRPDIDVISAMTLRMDKGGPTPVIFQYEEGKARLHEGILSKPGGLHEVVDGGIPGACFIAPRYVYQDMFDKGVVWHEDILNHDATNKEKFGNRKRGHDQTFCHNCNDMGFRTWVHSDVMWGHMKSIDIRLLMHYILEIRTAKQEAARVIVP